MWLVGNNKCVFMHSSLRLKVYIFPLSLLFGYSQITNTLASTKPHNKENKISLFADDIRISHFGTLISMVGRINAIKIVVLPRFVYIFQNLPVVKGERGQPSGTWTQVYRVPNKHSDHKANEPGSMAWQSEHVLTVVTITSSQSLSLSPFIISKSWTLSYIPLYGTIN